MCVVRECATVDGVVLGEAIFLCSSVFCVILYLVDYIYIFVISGVRFEQYSNLYILINPHSVVHKFSMLPNVCAYQSKHTTNKSRSRSVCSVEC